MKHLCTPLAICILGFSGMGARAQLVNGIRAIVHDSVVTYVDVQALTGQAVEGLVREYRAQPALLEQKVVEAERENLDTLVSRQLILQEFNTFNVPESIIETEVDREIEAEIKARFGDRITLMKTLQARGFSYEKYRQQKREQMIVSWLRQKNITSELIISPHKVETYYLAHREDEGFKIDEQVKLRMIVLNNTPDVPDPKKLAEEILQKLKEGASFAELAGIYSQGSQRRENGLWGWADKKTLRKELADVAFTLKPGEYSQVIELKDPQSYYLMLVEEMKPGHYKSLGEMRNEIEASLLLEERSRLEKRWIDKLRKKTFVQFRQ